MPILRKCDREQRPAYLEAGSEENGSFYLHSGFEMMGDIELPNGPTIFRHQYTDNVKAIEPSGIERAARFALVMMKVLDGVQHIGTLA